MSPSRVPAEDTRQEGSATQHGGSSADSDENVDSSSESDIS